MPPLLTAAELQEKFCEGFSFYPIPLLKQYGHLIYKCYKEERPLPKQLERSCRPLAINIRYALTLLNKLQQKDIAAARELLHRLLTLCRLLEAPPPGFKRPAAIHRQLLDGMCTFYGLMETYVQQALLRIASQLSEIPAVPGANNYPQVKPAQFRQVQNVIKEFLYSADTVCTFLNSCLSGPETPAQQHLLPAQIDSLRHLSAAAGVFKRLQEENLSLLEEWKQQTLYLYKQRTMN